MGYYDAISKKKAQAHMNEWNVVNYIMCPVVTKKLHHVFGDKCIVNPYQKPHRLINRLVELFLNPGDWVLDLFYGTSILISVINFSYRISRLYFLTVACMIVYLGTTTMCTQLIQELHRIGE